MMRTIRATAKFGNHISNCLKTSETAGGPTQSTRTDQRDQAYEPFVIRATKRPSRLYAGIHHKAGEARRWAMSLERTPRTCCGRTRNERGN